MSNVVDLKCSGNAVYFFLHHALSVGSRYGMLDSLERYEIMSSGALVPSLFKRCSILSTLSRSVPHTDTVSEDDKIF
nr:PREDICTED: uncharacterized protein LOC108951422 isoform X5 [Musa acuminata subsp. malaccensis]